MPRQNHDAPRHDATVRAGAWGAVAVAAAALIFVGVRRDGASPPSEGSLDSAQAPRIERPPNEPTGFRTLAEVTFERASTTTSRAVGASPLRLAVPEGWKASPSDDLGVDVDPDTPASPPWVGRATFPTGLGDGVSPTWLRREIDKEHDRRLFVSFWFKLSANWQGHETGVNKIGFAWMHQRPVVSFVAVGKGWGPLMPQIRLQDVRFEPARNLVPNVTPVPLQRDAWHRWEMLLVANHPGMRDGEARWWIDGELAGAFNDVVFAGLDQGDTWEVVTWRPVWGGRGDHVLDTMYMWMDDFYISGAP